MNIVTKNAHTQATAPASTAVKMPPQDAPENDDESDQAPRRLDRYLDGFAHWNADSDEVARAFRDDVARYSDMMSPGVRCLAGG